jgi:hypothetical protein
LKPIKKKYQEQLSLSSIFGRKQHKFAMDFLLLMPFALQIIYGKTNIPVFLHQVLFFFPFFIFTLKCLNSMQVVAPRLPLSCDPIETKRLPLQIKSPQKTGLWFFAILVQLYKTMWRRHTQIKKTSQ